MELRFPDEKNACDVLKVLDHLDDNIKAAERGPLSPELYAEVKRRMNFAGNIAGPVDMKLDW